MLLSSNDLNTLTKAIDKSRDGFYVFKQHKTFCGKKHNLMHYLYYSSSNRGFQNRCFYLKQRTSESSYNASKDLSGQNNVSKCNEAKSESNRLSARSAQEQCIECIRCTEAVFILLELFFYIMEKSAQDTIVMAYT